MRRARVLACCLAIASALPASVAGQPTAGFDALTPAAGTLPAGCALVPVAVERAQGGHVTGGLWAWQRLRSNPWTGQAPQILAEIRMRMFGPLALPDAPPDARTDAQIARTLVEGVSGYAAVYRQDGARVAVYALRSADRRRWTRSPVPERDDGTGQAFSRIGKGNVAALVVGDRGPCFAALERHLQSAVPATDAARTSRPASLLLDAAWLREGRARAEKGDIAVRTAIAVLEADAKIIETRTLPELIDGVLLLSASPAWTAADDAGLQAWMRAYLTWLLDSPHGREEAKNGNNHGTWYDVQVAGLALYTGQIDLARRTLDGARARIAAQIEPDGRQPRELERTRSWHYSEFNLAAFMDLADLGKHAGVDLWAYRTADGRSIRRAVDFIAPYVAGERRWAFDQITPFNPAAMHRTLRRGAAAWHDPQLTRLAERAGGGDSRLILTIP